MGSIFSREDKNCSICFGNDSNFKTICNHWFHIECLVIWIKGKSHYSCPNCRHKLINHLSVKKKDSLNFDEFMFGSSN
jgi:hypothetical protein